MANIRVDIGDCSPAEKDSLSTGGVSLQVLCREEAGSFDQYLRQWGEGQPEGSLGRDYAHGLAQWEQDVIAGYLYQKTMERF